MLDPAHLKQTCEQVDELLLGEVNTMKTRFMTSFFEAISVYFS